MGFLKKAAERAAAADKPETEKKATLRLADFIIENYRRIERVFFALFIVCAIAYPFVNVNYDLTVYLPNTAQSKIGMDLMEEKFGFPGTGRVMVDGVTIHEAKNIKMKLEAIDGVDRVMWLDTTSNVYGSEEFIDMDSVDQYYKDGSAVYDLVFDYGSSDKRTHRAINEIKELCGEKGAYTGHAMQTKALEENLSKEILYVIILGIFIIFAILLLTTESWIEPVLYLSVMGVAIVINMGSNIFLGTISFMTQSISALLQLATSMDYSIFLSHAFSRHKEKGEDQKTALKGAVDEALNSIFASSLTTIVGFFVLVFMEFSIGFDMGIVLSKGIFCSLMAVIFFMPALIIQMEPLMVKTAHRSFIPSFDKISRKLFKVRYAVLAFAILVSVPCYVAQGMNDFRYGNASMGSGPGTEVYEDEQKILVKFGRNNLMMALVPDTDPLSEKAFTEWLEDRDYVRSVQSLAGTLPEGVPESFLPESVTSLLHKNGYARMLIYTRCREESEYAFRCSNEIFEKMRSYYPEGSYLVGGTPSTIDIREILSADFQRVNILSIIGVFFVVMFSFKSFVTPILVILPIEVAIFLNMTVPYLKGETLGFVGFVMVTTVQLGATVDYAILTTNNYLAARKTMEKKEAAIDALNKSLPALVTSGSILSIVGYIIYFISTIAVIRTTGHLIGRGALFSIFFVCTILPAFFTLMDRILVDNEFAMLQRHLAKRRAKVREKLGINRKTED